MPKKAQGGPRDSVFTVRLPARLRFGLELTARLNNEPMTDVVVRALNEALGSENGGLFVELGDELPTYLLPKVWDDSESVRIVKLALVYPALLTPPERRAWEVVRGADKYWSTPTRSSRAAKPVRKLEDLLTTVLEADWDALLAEVRN